MLFNSLEFILFFIPPVYEDLKFRITVDIIIDETIQLIRENLKIVDDKGKFISSEFFVVFDHPLFLYFINLIDRLSKEF